HPESSRSTGGAKMCKAPLAEFEVCDVRKLGEHPNLEGGFDVVVCCENIEHILDDAKLVRDMALCMKPGGTLLLTTPNVSYRPISEGDNGPFLPIEDGRHVRKGYSPEDLQRLCAQAFLRVKEINYIAGFFSQKTTRLYRSLNCGVHPVAGWTTILPLRIVPPLLDDAVSKVVGWPGFSITLVAQKAAAPDA
ncbi:MAG: class I SAM-dependent methyltransferase, partial [Candidatus Korobacteraceae bacterium]